MIEIEFVIVLSGAAGLAVTVVARRLPVRATTGLVAAFSGLNTALAVLDGYALLASTNAAVAAFYLWEWMRRGGGGGPRCRLRAFAARFRGVRRSAPTEAGSAT